MKHQFKSKLKITDHELLLLTNVFPIIFYLVLNKFYKLYSWLNDISKAYYSKIKIKINQIQTSIMITQAKHCENSMSSPPPTLYFCDFIGRVLCGSLLSSYLSLTILRYCWAWHKAHIIWMKNAANITYWVG